MHSQIVRTGGIGYNPCLDIPGIPSLCWPVERLGGAPAAPEFPALPCGESRGHFLGMVGSIRPMGFLGMGGRSGGEEREKQRERGTSPVLRIGSNEPHRAPDDVHFAWLGYLLSRIALSRHYHIQRLPCLTLRSTLDELNVRKIASGRAQKCERLQGPTVQQRSTAPYSFGRNPFHGLQFSAEFPFRSGAKALIGAEAKRGRAMRHLIYGVLALLFSSIGTFLAVTLWDAPAEAGRNPVPLLWLAVASIFWVPILKV